MTDAGRVDIRPNATRLLGRTLEDPTFLGFLRERRFEPVDLHDGDLQAGYVVLCHLDRLGRLTYPYDESSTARRNAATANLRAISDWTIDRRRERERVRRARFDQAKPVPTSTELLLDAAARLNIVWWFNLWERAWPTVPDVGHDLEALDQERAYQRLSALGIRLGQRASARTTEPAEIADDVLDRLDGIDTTAISRYLTRRDNRSRPPVASNPTPESDLARTAVR